jgi:hypothetical protein
MMPPSKTVNNVGEQENQPEGIELSDRNGKVTLQDFAEHANDDDSNASDDDFKMDKEYQDEIDNEIAMEEEDSIIGNDDPDIQEDYFQTPIQQHDNNVKDNNEPASSIIPRGKRGNNNPAVAFSNIVTPGDQECAMQRKKKSNSDENTAMEDELDIDITSPINNLKVGVDDTIEPNKGIDDDEDSTSSNTPKELESDLGPYWALAHTAHACVLNTIASYSNIEASKSTPQYGFNRGLKEFGDLSYQAR